MCLSPSAWSRLRSDWSRLPSNCATRFSADTVLRYYSPSNARRIATTQFPRRGPFERCCTVESRMEPRQEVYQKDGASVRIPFFQTRTYPQPILRLVNGRLC